MTPNTKKEERFDIKMHKSTPKQNPSTPKYFNHEEFEETPTWAAVITVLGYAVLSALGWLRDFLRNIGFEEKKTSQDPNPKVRSFIIDHSGDFHSIFLLRILFHCMMDMKVSILEIYTLVFVMFSINLSPVLQVPKSMSWNVFQMTLIGHLSM